MILNLRPIEFLGRTTGRSVGIHYKTIAKPDDGFRILSHAIHDRQHGLLGELPLGSGKLKPLGLDRINSNVNHQDLHDFGRFRHVDYLDAPFISVNL
jgi:hypothetical protein